MSSRIDHLVDFYTLMHRLEQKLGGPRQLNSCHGRLTWPQRGIYFYREPGEIRTSTGTGSRIVRVGTHALAARSGTSLWNRLSQHKGPAKSGGGNHRGSIFRLIVGSALMRRDNFVIPTWGTRSSAPRDVRESEASLEQLVSKVIGAMPFLWLAIDDEPGPGSLRGHVERNSIALLSNSGKSAIDPPSDDWLGRYCDRARVQASGLWNQNHVDEDYDPDFLDVLEKLISRMPVAR